MPEPRTEPIPSATPLRLEGRTHCPRCGMPADDSHAVALHDLWHRQDDIDRRALSKLVGRLERFLDSLENLTTEDGKPQKFADWKAEVDEILEHLPTPEELGHLRALANPVEITLETADVPVIPWPGNPFADDEEELAEDEIRNAEVLPAEPEPEPELDADRVALTLRPPYAGSASPDVDDDETEWSRR